MDAPCTPELVSVNCTFHKTCEQLAEMCKNVGNDWYKSNDFLNAASWYSRAVSLVPWEGKGKVVLYSNLARALLKLERFDDVITYCTLALTLDPAHSKSLLRRAGAYEQIWCIIPAIKGTAMIFILLIM